MRVLSIAPTRLSLFGGGTDVQPYCDMYGGLTLSLAINIRQKILLLSDNEIYEKPKNTFPFKADPEFYYRILDEFGINGGHHSKILSNFDGYIESGLGSSAAAAVALIGAINKRKNLGMAPEEIAMKAWDLEVNKLGLFGGKQDQFAAAFGGVNAMRFIGGKVLVWSLGREYITKIVAGLVLFYTGESRQDAKIQERMKKLTNDRIKALDKIKKLCLDALEPIGYGDYRTVGKLLRQSWESKKESNPWITTKRIDDIYGAALKHGAEGGKIMGSGGGGYMFFLCNPGKKEKLIAALKEKGCEWVDFSVDWQGLETRRVPYCPL